MEQIDLSTYGSLPRHIRQSLATAEKPQPSQTEDTPVQVPSETENQSQTDVIEQTQTEEHTESQPVQPATPETPNDTAEDNDSKAWKGRLSKEQEEHKATKTKLLAEAEARQKAEAEAKTFREKLAALEQQNNVQQSNVQQSENPTPEPPPTATPSVESPFTDEDWTEIEFAMGKAGKKFVEHLKKQQQNKPLATQQLAQIDVEKVIDERFNQERQRNEEQAKAEAFGKAISEQAPTLQGLLDNSAFVEFINNKVIDFAGNTAATLLNFVGNNKRIDLVPKIAELVTEFEQSRQPPAQQVTAPPTNQSAAIKVQKTGKKPKPTPEILNKMQRLMRLGQTDELRELQEKYDLD